MQVRASRILLGKHVSMQTAPGLNCRYAISLRHFSQKTASPVVAGSDRLRKVRNIGIIAHIDAGKTTTTERMLYYAQKNHVMGDVDDGDTTMDFLEEERERGITIQAACITFGWEGHVINLIDTPGHVDFTVEVERSLRVLDGAVTVLDAVKGVEAQTETVWRQAARYHVPRICYVNKMDREGASLPRVLSALRDRLGAIPLQLQYPLLDGSSQQLLGLVDLVRQVQLEWELAQDPTGRLVTERPLDSSSPFFAAAQAAREQLVEQVAELDDELADLYLSHGAAHVSPEQLARAIRRVTLHNGHQAGPEGARALAVPVLCGASLRNTGVQPLLDAVTLYLPSPLDRPPQRVRHLTNKVLDIWPDEAAPLCALAFKVCHDVKRGPLVFVRVMAGVLQRGAVLSRVRVSSAVPALGADPMDQPGERATANDNTSSLVKERALKIVRVHADEEEDVNELRAGDIGAVVGLKDTHTGDTLVPAKAPQGPLALNKIHIPTPVFFCSVEAPSISGEEALQEALTWVQRDDPSLQVSVDADSGQTILKGMGELHLEIVANRLNRDLNVPCTLGPMHVAYRETITSARQAEFTHRGVVGGQEIAVTLDMELEPWSAEDEAEDSDGSLNQFRCGVRGLDRLAREALAEGFMDACSAGPHNGYPVACTRATLLQLDPASQALCTGGKTGTVICTALRSAAARCVAKLLKQGGTSLLEPLMHVEVTAPATHVSEVLSDLSSRRRGEIVSTETEPWSMHSSVATLKIVAKVPISEMLGYANALRSFTQGNGSFNMEFACYKLRRKMLTGSSSQFMWLSPQSDN
eukprot:g70507.t1